MIKIATFVALTAIGMAAWVIIPPVVDPHLAVTRDLEGNITTSYATDEQGRLHGLRIEYILGKPATAKKYVHGEVVETITYYADGRVNSRISGNTFSIYGEKR